MTHEPECPLAIPIVATSHCQFCIAIRAAYQRGREDAAKAVEALHFPIDLETVYGIDSPKKLACDHCAYIFYEGRRNLEREPWPCSTVTAARGDGGTNG